MGKEVNGVSRSRFEVSWPSTLIDSYCHTFSVAVINIRTWAYTMTVAVFIVKLRLRWGCWCSFRSQCLGLGQMLVYCAKQHIAQNWLFISSGNTSGCFLRSLSRCSLVNWSLKKEKKKKKVLKCCPRFPLRRQNKEATWSTPRTAPANINIGLFIRGNNVLTALYEEAIAFYVISPRICRGVVLFVSVFIRLLLGWRARLLCISMAAAVVGASGCDCYMHPVLAQDYQQMDPGCHNHNLYWQ